MIWRSTYHRRIAQLADFIIALISFAIAYYFSNILHRLEPNFFPPKVEIRTSFIILVLVLSIVYDILFDQYKAYSYQRFTSLVREYLIVIRVCFLGSLISISVLFLFGFKDISRTVFILFFVISLIFFILEKSLLFYVAAIIRKKGRNRKRVILVGTGTRTRNFIRVVNNNFDWGLDIIGILTGDKEKIGTEIEGIKVLRHLDEIQESLRFFNPEEIIITISTKRFDKIRFIIENCEREGVTVRLNSDFFGRITKKVTNDSVFGLNIISFDMVRNSELELLLKRVIDIIGSIISMALFSPFMILAAVGIYISDGFPIFYSFTGYGLNRKPIKIVKFRTMVKNSDDIKKDLLKENEMVGPVFKIKRDPRILPFGRLLRKFSVDETPQLLSVLKGDMSLVGPRQAMKEELDNYESWHRRRLSVKPGLTCLWQVNGRNQIADFDVWARLDLLYIDNWSIWLDIKILLKTVPVVIFGKGN